MYIVVYSAYANDLGSANRTLLVETVHSSSHFEVAALADTNMMARVKENISRMGQAHYAVLVLGSPTLRKIYQVFKLLFLAASALVHLFQVLACKVVATNEEN